MTVDALCPPGPRYGDPGGQAAAPRHAGDKSSGYQGNRVSHWGAATQNRGTTMHSMASFMWVHFRLLIIYWMGLLSRGLEVKGPLCLRGCLLFLLTFQSSDTKENNTNNNNNAKYVWREAKHLEKVILNPHKTNKRVGKPPQIPKQSTSLEVPKPCKTARKF